MLVRVISVTSRN